MNITSLYPLLTVGDLEAARTFYTTHLPFEVVFVSFDKSEDAMTNYMKKMPWSAVPFGDDRQKKLIDKFEVRSIPSVIILDANGNVLARDGRDQFLKKGAAALDDWQPADEE